MCDKPCSLCGDYNKCTIYYSSSRCRTCKHDKEDLFKSPCFNCIGMGLNPERDDKYEPKMQP